MSKWHRSAALAAWMISAAAAANGGDTCAQAVVIPSIPFSDTGFNCGMAHNQSTGFCSGTESGPDVFYSYTPKTNQIISIGLCDALGQPRLYVGRNGCGSIIACGELVCQNKAFQPAPRIDSLPLEAGVTYYIIVDSTSNGWCVSEYEIFIDEVICEPCPPGALQENEVDCGLAADGSAADTINGGCSAASPAFIQVGSGQSVCGTISANQRTGDRDTDWFEVHLSEPSRLTWTVSAPAQIIMAVPENNGVPDCSRLQCLTHVKQTGACLQNVTMVNRPAGHWWLVLMPQEGDQLSCDTAYTLKATVGPITADLDDNGAVDGSDLGSLLLAWMTPSSCPSGDCMADFNLDGVVDGIDLGALLAQWGPM